MKRVFALLSLAAGVAAFGACGDEVIRCNGDLEYADCAALQQARIENGNDQASAMIELCWEANQDRCEAELAGQGSDDAAM